MALWNFRVLPAHIEIGLLLIPSLSPLQPGCYHGPCEVLRITETPICSTDAGIIIKNFFFFWQLSLWIQPPQFPPNSVLLPINCLSHSHERRQCCRRGWAGNGCGQNVIQRGGALACCYDLYPFPWMSPSLFWSVDFSYLLRGWIGHDTLRQVIEVKYVRVFPFLSVPTLTLL